MKHSTFINPFEIICESCDMICYPVLSCWKQLKHKLRPISAGNTFPGFFSQLWCIISSNTKLFTGSCAVQSHLMQSMCIRARHYI